MSKYLLWPSRLSSNSCATKPEEAFGIQGEVCWWMNRNYRAESVLRLRERSRGCHAQCESSAYTEAINGDVVGVVVLRTRKDISNSILNIDGASRKLIFRA